jgi:SnoaL-like polyketide cyclase
MTTEEPPQKPLWRQGRAALLEREPNVRWRQGPPDYALSNQAMRTERTRQFAPDSLEAAVELIVQVYELEVSHKQDPAQWNCVVLDKFRTRTNGGPWHSAQDVAEKGSYNLFIGETPFYSAAQETFESSAEIFKTALPGGFFWEVLEVYSPPPVVAFRWRHWGTFAGPYFGHEPNGKRLEMFGMTVARCADDLRLLEVEHFYDNSLFLGQLTGGCPVARRPTAPAAP